MNRWKKQFTRRGSIVAASLLCAASAMAVAAQVVPVNESVPPPGGEPGTKKKRIVKTSGDYFKQEETPQGNVRTLKGNVKITSEETVFTSDLATYNENTGVAVSPGKLRVEDPDNILTGNTGTAFYKTRDVKIRDAVTIVIKPRRKDQNAPEGSSRRKFKDPVTVTCTKVDYNWRTKVADMTGDLTFKQTTRTVTADRAIYDSNAETLTLIGNVVYTMSGKNEHGKTNKAIAYLKEGSEKFELFNVTDAVTEIEDEDEPAANAKPGSPGANPAPARPGQIVPPTTAPTTPPVVPGAPPTTPANTPTTAPVTPAQPATTPPVIPGTTPTSARP